MRENHRARALRILLVDPNPDSRAKAAQAFQRAGASVTAVECGSDAIAELERHLQELVLSTPELPDGGGVEFLQQIGRRFWSVRVALMAPWRTRALAQRVSDAGMLGFLRSPVRDREALAILRLLTTVADPLE